MTRRGCAAGLCLYHTVDYIGTKIYTLLASHKLAGRRSYGGRRSVEVGAARSRGHSEGRMGRPLEEARSGYPGALLCVPEALGAAAPLGDVAPGGAGAGDGKGAGGGAVVGDER